MTRSEKISRYGARSAGVFSFRSESALIKDQEYFVKAFVRTENLTVVGTTVRFHSKGSLPPEISAFDPTIANWGDTLTLKGERFSARENQVFLGEIEGEVVSQSDSLLKVVVPFEKNEERVKLMVKTIGQEAISRDDFIYRKPVVDAFDPGHGAFGDTITISGSHFLNTESLKVTFNGQEAKILEASWQKLRVQAPGEANQKNLQLCVSANGLAGCSQDLFIVDPPVIERLSQQEVKIGENLVIDGRGFNPLPNNNVVLFGQQSITPWNASSSRLEVGIPDGVYDSRDVTVGLQTAEQEHIFGSRIRIMNIWLNKGSIPDHGIFSGVAFSFSHGQYGFCGIASDNQITTYRYNPAANRWLKTGTFPGTFRFEMTAFVIGDDAYVGGFNGTQDFWKYDILNNTWEQVADFPLPNMGMTSFAVNGNGYVVCTVSKSSNFWEYDVEADSWVKLSDFVQKDRFQGSVDLGFSYGSKGYLLASSGPSKADEFWEYDPSIRRWKQLASQMNLQTYGKRSFFIIKNEFYLMPDSYNEYLCKYNFSDNKWFIVSRVEGREDGLCFTVEDATYIGGGHNYGKALKDFWEYNPHP
ncbi:hypothetical protein JCM15548_12293 [Geofilum rubicundum JCM 15548]|uniref:IPT/TIG domain-containing protein n=2 Tax=Geofilum TaxID=1236988 RepID=A0A0E9LXS1_9BACT|nr:hypothetical protein JCM15548_12293 [Geofilum rubicundum JCM 15548]